MIISDHFEAILENSLKRHQRIQTYHINILYILRHTRLKIDQYVYSFSRPQTNHLYIIDTLIEKGGVCSNDIERYLMFIMREVI